MKTAKEIKNNLAEECSIRVAEEPDNGFNLDEFQRQGIINGFIIDKIADLQLQIQELREGTLQ